MSGERAVIVDLRQEAELAAGRGPLAPVCGLPVLVRTLLVLEREGYSAGVLLVRPGGKAPLQAVLARHPRLGLDLSVWEQQEPGYSAALDEAQRLTSALEGVLLWPGPLSFGRFAPAVALAPIRDGQALLGAPTEKGGHVGPLLLPPDLLDRHGEASWSDLTRALDTGGALERRPRRQKAHWLRGTDDLRAAERDLIVSLRKPEDGLVANYDRHISLFFSSRLMKWPVHPNLVTVCAGLLGVACGVIAAQGGYWWMLLAALLFQVNSILDGIDGEIARAKLLQSRLGEWLDTISDDASNLVFSTGVAIGCYNTWGGAVYLWLAGITALGVIMTAVVEYHYLITVAHSGDLNRFKMPWAQDDDGEPEEGEEQAEQAPGAEEGGESPAPATEAEAQGWLARILSRMTFLGRRDTFIFLYTIFGVAGQLYVMAWGFTVMATVAWLSIVGYRWILPLFRRSPGAA